MRTSFDPPLSFSLIITIFGLIFLTSCKDSETGVIFDRNSPEIKCQKPVDYKILNDPALELEVREIFKVGIQNSQKVERLRELSTTVQDIDSQMFRLCEAYGIGAIDKTIYRNFYSRLLDWKGPAVAVSAIASSLEMVNNIADPTTEIVLDLSFDPGHDLTIEGNAAEITARDRQGRVLKKVTAKDLEKVFATEELDHIKIYESEMRKQYAIWKELYAKRGSPPDTGIDKKLTQVVASMKDELLAILSFIEKSGFQLDDHYLYFRDAIERSAQL